MSSPAPSPIFFPPPTHPIPSHTDRIYTLALTSKYLITGSKDTTVRIWSLETQLPLHEFPLQGHTAAVLCLAVLESEGLVISGSSDQSLCCWDIESGELIKRFTDAHTESILDVKVGQDGKWIVTGGKDRCVKIWDREALGFSNHAETAPHSQDQTQNQDSTPPPQPLAVLSSGIGAAVNTVLITPSYVISGAGDRTIKIWDSAPPHACLRTIHAHERGLACLTLSPNGKKLVSGSSDNTVRIFDIETGAQEACMRGHENLVRRVCVVPKDMQDGLDDGIKFIISASYDENVVIWKRDGGVDGGWAIHRRVDIEELGRAFDGRNGREGSWDQYRLFSVQSDGRRVFASGQMNFVAAWDLD